MGDTSDEIDVCIIVCDTRREAGASLSRRIANGVSRGARPPHPALRPPSAREGERAGVRGRCPVDPGLPIQSIGTGRALGQSLSARWAVSGRRSAGWRRPFQVCAPKRCEPRIPGFALASGQRTGTASRALLVISISRQGDPTFARRHLAGWGSINKPQRSPLP